MVDLDEQLRSYASWLTEQADRQAGEQGRTQAVRVDPIPPTDRKGRRWWPLAAVAAVLALVLGLVATVETRDAQAPTDQPSSPTVSTSPAETTSPATTTAPATTAPESTSAPSTTVPEAEPGWSGGLLDDLDTESLRPLDSLTEGDVIVPTGPSGWRLQDSTEWTSPDNAVASEWSVDVIEARPNNGFGQVLYLRTSREPTCTTSLGCRPSGESVAIDGVVWESIVVERIPEDDPEFFDATTLRARVGDRWVSLAAGVPQLLTGPLLDNPPIIEFLEGLRVGSPEDLTAIGQACWQCGVAGAEGDPFAVTESPTATPTTMSDGALTETSEPQAQGPGDVDSDTGRPLSDLAEGDVVVASYIPPGLALQGEARIHEYSDTTTEFSFYLETADDPFSNAVRLWEHDGTVGPLGPAELDDPNHPPVEIAGITWGWYDFETARIASIGSFSVWVYLHGLDRSEAERFIEGLRAASIEQFPGPIAFDGADGLSVIDLNSPSDAEIVARDDRFELAAVQVGDQVCTKLEETTVPVTMTFAANCWESTRMTEHGIVDLYPLDDTDTRHLIIGVVDSPNATAVRITSPSGESVVVATGPVNQAIDGRFFLARLDLDASNGIRLDHFTIEDASP